MSCENLSVSELENADATSETLAANKLKSSQPDYTSFIRS